MAELKGFIVHLDTKPQWDMLSDQQAAALIRALLSYAESGEQLETEDGMLKIAFSFMSQQIDRDAEKYKAKCDRNAENAKKRWENENANASDRMQADANDANNNNNRNNNQKRKRKEKQEGARTPSDPEQSEDKAAPTEEEVARYCKQRKNGIDAARFVAYYDAVGWMQGSTPITDWRALVRKWETMPHSRDKPAQAGGSSIDTADLDALMRRGAS